MFVILFLVYVVLWMIIPKSAQSYYYFFVRTNVMCFLCRKTALQALRVLRRCRVSPIMQEAARGAASLVAMVATQNRGCLVFLYEVSTHDFDFALAGATEASDGDVVSCSESE